MSRNETLVSAGDLDELTREVDRLIEAHDYHTVVDLRDRCRKALERGKQLWAIASHCDYRLALEAPSSWSASVLNAHTGGFALGPLTEVAASTHNWSDLEPFIEDPTYASLTAHECVVRRQTVNNAPAINTLELPYALGTWEPSYAVANYSADKVEAPMPGLPTLHAVDLTANEPDLFIDSESTRALEDLVRPWTTQSNGRIDVVVVEGGPLDAIKAHGIKHARTGELTLAHATALMAWAAAGGGAHGRRRGAASGRFATWWALASLTELTEAWPISAADLGAAASQLRFWWWDAGEPETGWALRLAIEDPIDELSWAIAATDDD